MNENKNEKVRAIPKKTVIILAAILAAAVIVLSAVFAIPSAVRLRQAKKLQTTIAAGLTQIVALRTDGIVVAMGQDNADQCDTGDWRNIVSVAAGARHTVGLRKDGTVVSC